MKAKNLKRLKPGSLVMFLIMCTLWFLKFSGIFRELLDWI